ncbi:MAG: hypothetical protein ACI8P3_001350 [Saprospiraceae bacterium]|jgi:hypothetical protein
MAVESSKKLALMDILRQNPIKIWKTLSIAVYLVFV